MTTFSNDADLLAIEPNVFVDLPMIGQQRLAVADAAVSGTTVSTVTGGATAIASGSVVTLRQSPAIAASYAVASVDDDNTLTLAGAPSRFDGVTGLSMTSHTFLPQALAVHDDLLGAVGIDVDDPDQPYDASAIVSTGLMKRLEVLGTLSRAYRAATQLDGGNEQVEASADGYERRFARAVGAARVLIDTDGDGRADTWRCPAVRQLVRV